MKVFAYPPGENWIVDRITSEFNQNTKHELANTPNDADTIMLFAPWCWDQYRPAWLTEKKFVMMLHHIVPHKFNHSEFIKRDYYVDHYIVPNEHTLKFIRKLTIKPITQICYWLNPELWSQANKTTAKAKVQFECSNKSTFDKTYSLLGCSLAKKFVIGSFQRDTEGSDLKTPKLEKGPDIFVDTILNIRNNIDKEIVVLLGGWRRQYVIDRLREANIKYIYFEQPPVGILNIMYNACDLYIVGSRFEGGPQAILECAYNNIPVISTDVGIARDILHKDCVLDLPNEFIQPTEEHITFAKQNVDKVLVSNQVTKIDEILNNV